MRATLTVWQLNVNPNDPATHPGTSFAVNNTWTLVSNSISMISGSFDLRVEFYLNSLGTALDIDSVFVN
jgi:hypothetical protein